MIASSVEERTGDQRYQVPMTPHTRVELPQVSRFLSWGFHWYVPRYLRRHFNAVRVAKQTVPTVRSDGPLICFANHPGWWDPLIAFLLNECYFAGRTAYSPIDEQALKQYPVFRRLGFYGIDLDSLSGAKRFLAVSRGLLKNSQTAIWITPGGRIYGRPHADDVSAGPGTFGRECGGNVAGAAGPGIYVLGGTNARSPGGVWRTDPHAGWSIQRGMAG